MRLAVVKRVLAGLGMGAFWAVVLLYLPPIGLFGLLLAFSTLCQWEFYNLAEQGGYAVCRPIGLALGALWLTVVFAHPAVAGAGTRLEALVVAGGGLVLLLRLLFDPHAKRPLESAGITLLGLFYVPFLMSFYIRLAQFDVTGPFHLSRGGLLLAFYASLVVKMADVGGYAAGIAIGRHKMFPRISPAKSWEGLAGGMVLSVVASLVVVWIAKAGWSAVPVTPLREVSYLLAAGLGVLIGAVGVAGDLIESMFKRSVGVKDSGGVLPGLGGFLDIFDSLLFAPALLYFLLPYLS
jgi:phosphatidate cytidylyltransferase